MREKSSNAKKIEQCDEKKKHSLCHFIYIYYIYFFVYIVHIFDRDVVFNHRFSHKIESLNENDRIRTSMSFLIKMF